MLQYTTLSIFLVASYLTGGFHENMEFCSAVRPELLSLNERGNRGGAIMEEFWEILEKIVILFSRTMTIDNS